MSLIAWLILGLVSGFVASKIVNKTGEGLILDVALGVLGAVVGGWVASRFFHMPMVNGLNIYSFVVAVAGAVGLLLAYHLVVRRRV